MTIKLARLRFECKKGIFMLSKVTDIETGLIIPVRSIKIEANVDDNPPHELIATIVVPIEELALDGVLTKIETWDERDHNRRD